MGRRSKRRNKRIMLATLMVVVSAVSMYTLNLLKPNLLSTVLSVFYGSTSLEINPVQANLAVNSNETIDAKTAFDNIDPQTQKKTDSFKNNNNAMPGASKTSTLSNEAEFGLMPGIVNGNSVVNNQSGRLNSVLLENEPFLIKVLNLGSASKPASSVKTMAAGTASSSTNSIKQSVGGKPAEPGVTGTLPLGDGTWILLLLGLGYVTRKIARLA